MKKCISMVALVWVMWVNQGNGWTQVQRFDTEAMCKTAAQAYVKGQPPGVQAGCAIEQKTWTLRYSYRGYEGWIRSDQTYTSYEDCARAAWEFKEQGHFAICDTN